mmetsp:Transcript_43926/g.133801  ORF Transcript_43926/g.133801 Transcript_43926/m.133801 type:complete len:194 (-) Transcript_43926:1877-2458(-)
MNGPTDKPDESNQKKNGEVEHCEHHDEGKPFEINERADWRQSVGRVMHEISNTINDNIVVARYGTIATVALLAGYGMYRTPLFFRFRTVSEIPPDHFVRRKVLHGRLIEVLEEEGQGGVEKPLKVLVRHLSPIGRFQHRAAFDFSAETMNPSARLAGRIENSKDLLKIEIGKYVYVLIESIIFSSLLSFMLTF